jgi:hypothetical protein
MLCFAGGPPRFMCPFVPGSAPIVPRSDLPFLLYLPGIDGTGLAASKQFPALSTYFDFAAFSVPPHDRTWFPGLIEQIECVPTPSPPDQRLLRPLLAFT